MAEYRLLSTSGILGYGFPEDSIKRGVAMGVDMIGCDGGSTDPGPHYLGSGKTLNSRLAMKRDLRLMLKAAVAEVVIEELRPIQRRYHELMEDVGDLDRLLARGAERAEAVSSPKIREVKQRMGLVLPRGS